MSPDDATLSPGFLTRNEWTDGDCDVRMKFRRDGTGYYEREMKADRPFLHENFLWRVEGESTLHLKFAHARSWATAQVRTSEGTPTNDGRFGRWLLAFERDPYAWTIDETLTGALLMRSDRGAPLP